MSMKDRVRTVLSEVRTLALGSQILLGFQYQAVFRPGFEKLPAFAKALEGAALGLLTFVLLCLVAPSPFHRMAEGGEATRRVHDFARLMMVLALPAFAAALAANITMALTAYADWRGAVAAGVATAVAAAVLWFGLPFVRRMWKGPSGMDGEKDEKVSLDEKISELLGETRIILPGAQALLGFQFAAFFTEVFEKLPAASQAVHTGSLLLVALALVLLMTPAPYHRLGEGGDNTEHFDRTAVRIVLAALVPLAGGLAGVIYVVLERVSGSSLLAGAASAVTLVSALALWFGLPLAIGRHRRVG